MIEDAQAHASAGRRVGARLLALLNLVGAGVLALFGLLGNGLRCDDNCSIAPGWRNDPTAWQWDALLIATLVILGSALLLNVVLNNPHLRKVAVLVQVAALAFFALLSLTSGARGGASWVVVLVVFFVATGVGSARLATR